MGVYTGKVTRITEEEVWVEIADLAIDQDFPCRWVSTTLALGDFVLVVNVNGAQEDLVVIGKMNGEDPGTIISGDIDGGTF